MLTERGPADDRDVFAYIGWLMHRGFVPYRDLWDHKGPVLYAVNWLGWSITPDSTVGIGFLQVLAYLACFWGLARIAQTLAPSWMFLVAAFAAVAFLAQTGEGGNMAETWALLPIAASNAIVFEASRARWRDWLAMPLGISLAATLLIRPNLAAEPFLASIVTILALQTNQRWRAGLLITGTVILACAAALVPLWVNGAIPEFIAAYWTYNAAYSRLTTLADHVTGFAQLLFVMRTVALLYGAIVGWLFLMSRRPRETVTCHYRLFLIVALPAEFGSAALSGRPFYHYLVPLFPVATVLFVIGLRSLLAMLRSAPRWFNAVAWVMAVLLVALQCRKYAMFAANALRTAEPEHTVAAFLKSNTSANDRIMPIGDIASMQVALASRRLPASKYIYQLPLIHRANVRARQQQDALLLDIATRRPAAIFSTPGPAGSLCDAIDPEASWNSKVARRDGYKNGLLRTLLAPELRAHYYQVQNAQFGSACVYLRSGLAH